MKRSTAITLVLLGAGSIAVYGASRGSCQPDDWNDTQSCRSSSSSGVHFGHSFFRRGGFGKTGSVHSAGS